MLPWLALVLCVGCFQLQVTHSWVDEPVPDEHLERLEPGVTDLARSLELLGAPRFVWEYDGDGMALAWGWIDQWAPGFTISYNFERFAPSARLSLSWDSLDWMGVVLFFDSELLLERAERGYLSEIAVEGRPRPALVEGER